MTNEHMFRIVCPGRVDKEQRCKEAREQIDQRKERSARLSGANKDQFLPRQQRFCSHSLAVDYPHFLYMALYSARIR